MNKNFKKCPNGHYYQQELQSCPFCKNPVAGGSDVKTRIIETSGVVDPKGKTEVYTADAGKTRVIVEPVASKVQNKTHFVDPPGTDGASNDKATYRPERMLVGWLVTFSYDRLGADFRLFEGRNEIGRDIECSITVPDKTMSGRHATILFRNGKFLIKDELSSHGTFVNQEDIEQLTVELNDNDVIRMGETDFKFKTAF
ncbi:MAG: FHA domain-containing protein [Tannerella sp.]|jgi:hypothetical protein|nr:FHA domain-containing protein [Tannerella sp.]